MISGNGIIKKKKRFNPGSAQVLAAGFLIIIFIGALLLSLPAASADGTASVFSDCLFTATSATCITGLVVVDTFTHWSVFGQAVILVLIQIGGLGFMTFATLFSLVFRKNVSFKDRLNVAESLNLYDWHDIKKFIRGIVAGTFLAESVGAVILSAAFFPQFGWGGLWKGAFLSISAFCNAGFDLLGENGAFSSLTSYATDPVVNITVIALIIIGGLGFLVWDDIIKVRRFSRMSVFSKTVLTATALLIISGALVIFTTEYSNPETLGIMSVPQKILASFMQSVSPRTAGVNTIDLAAMADTSKIFIIILMFIGASSGSTGGGVKVSTAAVLFSATLCMIKGRSDTVMFKRKIPASTVMRAFALVALSIVLVFVSAMAITEIESVDFMSAAFECVSAFATVGLSLGITPALSTASRIILMLLMYLGRVGILTVTFALFTDKNGKDRIDYPEGRIIIG